MNNILITGGAGFIGSNIIEYIIKNKLFKKIRVLDNLSTGFLANIQQYIDNNDIEFIHGDTSNLEVCRKSMKNIDCICHQAALGSVPRSIKDPLSSHISNVNGFLNILISAHENGIKRIVYASSSSVYGDEKQLPKCEDKIGNALSPYAATKQIDEIYANVFTRCYGMECIGLRYFNVFGPRQNSNGPYAAVIPKFIDYMIHNQSPEINGDGSYSRDFTYIENVVQANILALTTENIECFGDIFNIGAGGRISILDMTNIIKENIGFRGSIIFGSIRPGDIPHSNADITKAKNMLGYDPKIDFDMGIKKLLQYNHII